jgi:hypothetical protein
VSLLCVLLMMERSVSGEVPEFDVH